MGRGTPINKIFDEAAIQKSVDNVMGQLKRVADAMAALDKSVNILKTANSITALDRAMAAVSASGGSADKAVVKLKTETEQLTVTMTKAAAAAQGTGTAAKGAADAMTLYERAVKKLNDAKTDAGKNAATVNAALQEERKKMRENAREALGLVGPYQKLEKEYKAATLAAKNFGATLGVQSTQYKESAAKALDLANRLKAIDAGVGQFQRNVGNYASGFQSFNQVLREMPNFAISATTGIQALSNNIPMLVDEITLARANGMSWGQTLKTLGQSLFSLGGFAVAATALLTGLPKIYDYLAESAEKLLKAQDGLNSVSNEQVKIYSQEKAELDALVTVANSKKQSDIDRQKAVKELNERTKDLGGNMRIENGELKGQKDILPAYLDGLNKRALGLAYLNNLATIQNRILESENSGIKENITFWDQFEGTIARIGSGALGEWEKFDYGEFIAKRARQRRAENTAAIRAEGETLKAAFLKALQSGEATIDLGGKGDKETKAKRKAFYDAETAQGIAYAELMESIYKSIAANSTKSDQERVFAFMEAYKEREKIMQLELAASVKAINAEELTQKEKDDRIKVRQAEFLKERTQAELEYQKELGDLTKTLAVARTEEEKKREKDREQERLDSVKGWEKQISEAMLVAETDRDTELAQLNKDYLAGQAGDYEAYEAKKLEIMNRYLKKQLQAQIDVAKQLLATNLLSVEERMDWEKKLAEMQAKLSAIGITKVNEGLTEQQKRLKKLESLFRDIDQAVRHITNSISEIASIGFENTKVALEEEKTAIEKNYALELERIKNTTVSEQEKAALTVQLEARKQAQIEANERRRRQLEQERARFERLNSIASIISGTALAVVRALGDAATPGPGRIILASLVGALGAAQLAKAIATPIPKYKYGVDSHPGGLAIVGDGGKSERAILPSGEYFDTPSKSTLMNLPKGTKVLPDAAKANKAMLSGQPRYAESTRSNQNAAQIAEMQARQIVKGFAKNRPKVNTKVNINLGREGWLYNQVYK